MSTPPSPGKETGMRYWRFGLPLRIADLATLLNALFQCHTKWYNLGIQLRVDMSMLDSIKVQYDDSRDQLREVIKGWLTTSDNPTWEVIVKALRSPVIGEDQLAMQLQQMYHSSSQQPELVHKVFTVDEVLPTVDDSPLEEDDLFDVLDQMLPISAKWKALGLGLRLNYRILYTIENDRGSPTECMNEVVLAWLRREYNVERFGEPTWRTLVQVVAHPAAGDDPTLAQKIAEKHPGDLVYTILVLDNILYPVSVCTFFARILASKTFVVKLNQRRLCQHQTREKRVDSVVRNELLLNSKSCT